MDYAKLERALGDAKMELEISNIQKAGIDELREYLRTQAVVGARRLALRYEFVCPTVSSDLTEAGRSIARSFYGQAQSSKKGSLFLCAPRCSTTCARLWPPVTATACPATICWR